MKEEENTWLWTARACLAGSVMLVAASAALLVLCARRLAEDRAAGEDCVCRAGSVEARRDAPAGVAARRDVAHVWGERAVAETDLDDGEGDGAGVGDDDEAVEPLEVAHDTDGGPGLLAVEGVPVGEVRGPGRAACRDCGDGGERRRDAGDGGGGAGDECVDVHGR